MKQPILATVVGILLTAPAAAQSIRLCAVPDSDSSGLPAACAIALLPPPAPDPALLPPPPAPARPVLHEYHWPAQPSDEAKAATFLLVLRDSTVRRAIAVWQQDGALHFLTPEHASQSVRLQAIDRAATRRLNAERGLTNPLSETGSSH